VLQRSAETIELPTHVRVKLAAVRVLQHVVKLALDSL